MRQQTDVLERKAERAERYDRGTDLNIVPEVFPVRDPASVRTGGRIANP